MHQYLDWLHPPGLAVHTFERFGETIDCVPIRQQPALRGRSDVIATPPPEPADARPAPSVGTRLTVEQAFFQGGPDSLGRKCQTPLRPAPLTPLKLPPSICSVFRVWKSRETRPASSA
jgi:hypothetical protein